MASPGDVLYAKLTADATLAALVGNRIYDSMAPEKTELPFVELKNISGVEDMLLDGSVSSLDQRWQFNSWGRSKKEAETVRDALVAVMKMKYTEVTVDGVINKILGTIQQTVLEPQLDTQARQWYAINDFLVYFGRSA